MKKIILITLFALLFTSCTGNVSPDNLDFNKSFTLTTEIEYNGAVSTADFTRTSVGEWEGVLTAPYALQGMQVSFTPTEMKVSYADFGVDLGESIPPEINVSAFMMIKTLESAFTMQNVNAVGGRDGIEISGMFDGDSYVLRLDKEGIPLSLEMPRRQLKVTFSGVTASTFRVLP